MRWADRRSRPPASPERAFPPTASPSTRPAPFWPWAIQGPASAPLPRAAWPTRRQGRNRHTSSLPRPSGTPCMAWSRTVRSPGLQPRRPLARRRRTQRPAAPLGPVPRSPRGGGVGWPRKGDYLSPVHRRWLGPFLRLRRRGDGQALELPFVERIARGAAIRRRLAGARQHRRVGPASHRRLAGLSLSRQTARPVHRHPSAPAATRRRGGQLPSGFSRRRLPGMGQ